MKSAKKLIVAVALSCASALLSGTASAAISIPTQIDLNVHKLVAGQDIGQGFEFDLYQPFSLTTFELGGGDSAGFSPYVGFFVTEKSPGSARLSSVEVTGSAYHGFYHSIAWASPADKPGLPEWLDFLSAVVPDNGAGGVCLATSCAFDVTFTNATSEVPPPAAAWLFGSGLIAVAGIARRRKTLGAWFS